MKYVIYQHTNNIITKYIIQKITKLKSLLKWKEKNRLKLFDRIQFFIKPFCDQPSGHALHYLPLYPINISLL